MATKSPSKATSPAKASASSPQKSSSSSASSPAKAAAAKSPAKPASQATSPSKAVAVDVTKKEEPKVEKEPAKSPKKVEEPHVMDEKEKEETWKRYHDFQEKEAHSSSLPKCVGHTTEVVKPETHYEEIQVS